MSWEREDVIFVTKLNEGEFKLPKFNSVLFEQPLKMNSCTLDKNE